MFANTKIFLIGDPMHDVYHFGHYSKLSQEAPIQVWVQDRQETREGGAANVRRNLEGLGCLVDMCFPVVTGWGEKHRYFVGQYQVFRLDRDKAYTEATDYDPFKFFVPDAIVISDYGKGFVSSYVCQNVIQQAQVRKIPVIVDPKGPDWRKYRGCTVITPNEKEMADRECGTQFENLIIKKGENGMSVHMKDLPFVHVPAQAKHVYDVCGAGDVVTAVIAAYLGSGGTDLVEAAHIASKAAGWSVGEIGTVAITEEILWKLA